jgi:glycosyltransferase involved in cell wall biosynthesis
MKLSVLIPAYNYPEGIKSILLKAQNLKYENINHYEIIIFDNSFDDQIYNLYKIFKKNLNIFYKKIPRTVGVINNWNLLLKQASGNYIYMIHHDDVPEQSFFFRDLIKKINKYKNYDIFIYSCKLKSKYNFLNRPNFIFFLKKIIVRYFPGYLLRRNVIGSISNIVFKNKHILFNKKLLWLVDVDFYYRLIKKSKKIILATSYLLKKYLPRNYFDVYF